jgi:CubicO group peptidase (beta-lactamase class C family)
MKRAILTAVVLTAIGRAQTVPPESVGFSTERLGRLHAAMERTVEDKELAGIVTVLARHGKIVDLRTYGKKDLASGASMDRDTIFRIWSMTKPITGVAMMMLYEQGKWSPEEPIAKYIPEFAKLKVDGGADPVHPPTMGELMSHTAGFTYGVFGDTAVDKAYQAANVLGSANLQQMVEKVAKIPLLYQPGTKWVYSISVDIQGHIVEKLSGKTLGEFMRANIFQPLGMKDTGFHIPADQLGRMAGGHRLNAAGHIVSAPVNVQAYAKEPGMPSGGGGLVSTAPDYLRFAQMLANGGELDGVRILAPSSVTLMRSNRLSRAITDSGVFGIGASHMNAGFGFGFDFGTHIDPAYNGRTVGKGTYTWAGAEGTWFWIDPANDIVFVGMIQRDMNSGKRDMMALSQQAVYQALLHPEK